MLFLHPTTVEPLSSAGRRWTEKHRCRCPMGFLNTDGSQALHAMKIWSLFTSLQSTRFLATHS